MRGYPFGTEERKPIGNNNYTMYQISILMDKTGELLKSKEMLLVGKGKLAEREDYAFINLDGVTKNGSNLWYLLAPFSFALDVLIFPYEIFSYVNFKT